MRDKIAVILACLLSGTLAWAQPGPTIGPGSTTGGGVRQVVTINATDVTITSANVSWFAVINMSTNHVFTLPDIATVVGREFVLLFPTNQVGSVGNYSVNATAGNVNGIATVAVTNTSGGTGNVSAVIARAVSVSYGYSVSVMRK